jgi:hypothetical protein
MQTSKEEHDILDWAEKQGFLKLANRLFGPQPRPPMQPYIFERIRAFTIRLKEWWRR